MVAARKQLKESLAAREETLRYYRDLVGYLDRHINPAVGEALEGARHYARANENRRRRAKELQEARDSGAETLQQQVHRAFGYQIDRPLDEEIFMGQNTTAKRDEPTREEIETAAKVCEQLGHRVTALALRNRLERSDA